MSKTKTKLLGAVAHPIDPHPIDPAVVARERGKVLREPAPSNPGLIDEHPYQARGPPTWLSLVKTANYLGLSTMTITRYATEEKYSYLNFPKPSVLVDSWRWNVNDLDSWMRSRVGAVSSRRKSKEIVA